MLSFNPVKENASRHVAAILDKQDDRNPVEFIYFTELSRGDKKPETDFEEKLKQYTVEGSTVKDFKLKDDRYELMILPSNNVKGIQREAISVFGKPGCGKSYQIAQYVRNYLVARPRNKVYFYSANKLKNDPSYDEYLREKIIQVDLMTVDCPIDPADYTDSLFIFDDVLDVDVGINPAEVFEGYATAPFNQKMKMQKDCDKQSKAVGALLNSSVRSIYNLGRKYNISCIAVYHKHYSGERSTFVLQGCTSCWVFPYSTTDSVLKSFLADKLSFPKEEAQAVVDRDHFLWEFMTINNSGKIFYFTPNHFKVL